MAYTAQQLQNLLDVRASGQLSVQFGDRRVQYQSGADLDKAIEQAKRDVAGTALAANPSRNRRYGEYGRGY